MTHKEKIINGLYGLAVADAVGNEFEFLTQIDKNSILEYANFTDRLDFSDDTQMTLFGFEAMKSVIPTVPVSLDKQFTKSYLDWHRTQTEEFDPTVACGLLQFKELFEEEAPGQTCLSALLSIKNGYPVVNNSMGCGSVMRLLPVMLLSEVVPFLHLVYLGSVTGAITHKHKANTRAINEYIKVSVEILAGTYEHNYNHINRIEQLGLGWIAGECVSMGVWAYEQATTFDELLQLSITHDGDSDSVAAVAGSLWGLSGKKVPQKYIDKLYGLNAIKYIVDNL